jgi:hypothetical protein
MEATTTQPVTMESTPDTQHRTASRAQRPRRARRLPSASLLIPLVCVGLEVTLAACSDAAPPSPETPSLAASSDALRAAASASPAARLLPCPPRVPEALNPPADATLELAWPASGVQIYACARAKPSDAPAWSLEGPHAVLTAGKAVAAIHFAGPIWQALDGSQVKGARLAGADAPDATAVPWLLMSAIASGDGTFARTTHIQRLDTVGGKAPASGCDAAHLGARVLVPYQASYFFYRHASGGEAIHQCRSGSAKPGQTAKPAASPQPGNSAKP